MIQLTKQSWTYFSAILLLAGAFWIWITTTRSDSTTNGKLPAPHQGFLAPDFKATTLTGEEITLSSLRGQPVLVNLWASWCLPCRREMPALEQVYKEYHEDGFILLAVNATDQDQLEKVRAFTQELGLTFPILLDEAGEISRAYQLSALPTSFFISADGTIQDVVVGGPMSEALLRSRVENLFNKRNSKEP